MIAKARIHSRRKDSIAGRHVTDRMVDSRHPDSSGLVSQGLMQVRHRSHEVWILMSDFQVTPHGCLHQLVSAYVSVLLLSMSCDSYNA